MDAQAGGPTWTPGRAAREKAAPTEPALDVLSEEFGARVILAVRLPEEHAERYAAALRDSSGGTAAIERVE